MNYCYVMPFLVACIAMMGCQTTTMYSWGKYDQELYRYYKNAENRVHLKSELETIFTTAEEKGQTVAPGLFAEYGYLLLEEGDQVEAAKYFAMEKAAWPESSAIMDRMIVICTSDTKADAALSMGTSESGEIL